MVIVLITCNSCQTRWLIKRCCEKGVQVAVWNSKQMGDPANKLPVCFILHTRSLQSCVFNSTAWVRDHICFYISHHRPTHLQALYIVGFVNLPGCRSYILFVSFLSGMSMCILCVLSDYTACIQCSCHWSQTLFVSWLYTLYYICSSWLHVLHSVRFLVIHSILYMFFLVTCLTLCFSWLQVLHFLLLLVTCLALCSDKYRVPMAPWNPWKALNLFWLLEHWNSLKFCVTTLKPLELYKRQKK